MRVVADVETDGLLDELTKIHCLSIRDLESGVLMKSCANQPGYEPIESGLRWLMECERVYFHNGIKFDLPAIRKVYPWFNLTRDQLRDTLVIAQMRFAHIKEQDFAKAKLKQFPGDLAGSHTLEAWGIRLGVHKTGYTEWCAEQGIENPWAKWCPEMQSYCDDDTATGRAIALHIRKFAPPQFAMDIETHLAYYLAAQEQGGVPFDMEKAIALQGQWVSRRAQLELKLQSEFGPRYKKDGKPKPWAGHEKGGHVRGAHYQKLKLVDFNPGSRQDIEYHLKTRFGWTPTEFTDSGQAKIDEKTLKGLNAEIPAVKLLLEYLLVEKRLGQLAEGEHSWFAHATDKRKWGGQITGLVHIHGRIKQNHAITHRASHSNPNLSAVPKVGKPFGEECRELFYVPEGWTMVGADASSLEARCLAHYLAKYDGGAYGKILLEGDVHTANRIALGLPGDEFAKVARDSSKNWFYAWMYGGGPEKLGSMLATPTMADGRPLLPRPKGGWTKDKLRKLGLKMAGQFLDNLPAFKNLIKAVQSATKKKGYVILPDGRRAYVRSSHSALNTLLQGAGAIIVKLWIANFSRILWEKLGEPGWCGLWTPLLWSHDECQLAIRDEHVPFVQNLLVEEMRKITEAFQWRVALDGEAKSGRNWKETH